MKIRDRKRLHRPRDTHHDWPPAPRVSDAQEEQGDWCATDPIYLSHYPQWFKRNRPRHARCPRCGRRLKVSFRLIRSYVAVCIPIHKPPRASRS